MWTQISGGKRLKSLREAYGKTQLVVELDASLGTGYLQRIESGRVQQPERETLERILDALCVRYSERCEVMNLFVRRNLLFARVTEPAPRLPFTIKLGTPEYPVQKAADPSGFALEIRRTGNVVFAGETTVGRIKRSLPALAEWLYRENSFPHGSFLMTGTGIVPPDAFTLQSGDEVRITIDPVGSTATFTYVVTNTGNVPIGSVVVVDDNGTAGTGDDFNPTFTGGDTNNNNLLDLTETWTYTAMRTVTAGQYTNVSTVTGNPVDFNGMDIPGDMDVTDSDPPVTTRSTPSPATTPSGGRS